MRIKAQLREIGMRIASIVLVACALAVVLPLQTGAQDPPPWPAAYCTQDQLGEQTILICLPPSPTPDPLGGWNGVLVVYAHGYVSPQLPLALPAGELGQIQLPDGQSAVEFILDQGFAFATTSYSTNGYAVGVAEQDLNALVDRFWAPLPPVLPRTTLLVGASEGGIITVQQIEKHPSMYQGGLAMCGPVGGMPAQIQYLGDFRVVFDQFFQNVFRFGVVDVPEDAYLDWGKYESTIQDVILRHPSKSAQLFEITNAAWVPDVPETWVATAQQSLHFSVFGTNDMIATAGGNPYENDDLWYTGARSDIALNAKVERVEAWGGGPGYVAAHYQPSGNLVVPLVTLHNPLDPQVPYWHEAMYAELVGGSPLLTQLTSSVPYGHCAFEPAEVVGAFNALIGPLMPPGP
jgi:hypothetical protein